MPAKTLFRMLSSYPWYEYECGRISQVECYERVAFESSLSISEVAEAFSQARDSLKINHEMISVLKKLKAQSNGSLKVYAMSNIGVSDYEVLRAIPAEWDIFNDVFISGQVGQRKPDLGFYRHVLDVTQTDPRRTIFVDDKIDNVGSAASFGIHGIIFDDKAHVVKELRNLLGDPLRKGRGWLEGNAQNLWCMTNTGVLVKDNFSQLFILESTGQRYVHKAALPIPFAPIFGTCSSQSLSGISSFSKMRS